MKVKFQKAWICFFVAAALLPNCLADESVAIISPEWLGRPLAGSAPFEFSKEGELPANVSFDLKDGKITGFSMVYPKMTFEQCLASLKKDWGEPTTVIAPGKMVVWRPESFRGTITLMTGDRKSDGPKITIRKFIVIKAEE